MIDRRSEEYRKLSEKRMKQRYRADRRFRMYGQFALVFGALALCILLGSIFSKGYTAFFKTKITLDVNFDPEVLGVSSGERDRMTLEQADFYSLVNKSVYAAIPGELDRSGRRAAKSLFSNGASVELRNLLLEDPSILGTTQKIALTAASDLDQMHKGNTPRDVEESLRRVKDQQLEWYDRWVQEGRVSTEFNVNFFTSGDSRDPELAGIGGAIAGSIYTLIVCFLLSFPIGVAAAVYLEEFAPKNKWTDVIEVNINNLAAVPSIIFGLLGLAILLNVFNLPRGTPLVGGMVLALMTLPTIIIACRASLKAVPPSIREGALAMGASPMQVTLHHVLPLALPGTLTGTIIGLSQALGETAPLLMIGMVAFIVDVPNGIGDPSAVLPVQIYLWAESAERGFVEKTSAAIMIILAFLIMMNVFAIYLRQKFERRW